MSETSAQIFARSVPIDDTPPKKTKRAAAVVWDDVVAQKAVIHDYDAALKAEGNWPPVQSREFTKLHQVLDHLIREFGYARMHGNQ
jgi:hypothetical protein